MKLPLIKNMSCVSRSLFLLSLLSVFPILSSLSLSSWLVSWSLLMLDPSFPIPSLASSDSSGRNTVREREWVSLFMSFLFHPFSYFDWFRVTVFWWNTHSLAMLVLFHFVLFSFLIHSFVSSSFFRFFLSKKEKRMTRRRKKAGTDFHENKYTRKSISGQV